MKSRFFFVIHDDVTLHITSGSYKMGWKDFYNERRPTWTDSLQRGWSKRRERKWRKTDHDVGRINGILLVVSQFI
ncbi:hypothetical protein PIL02S_05544 [Paenibacillus illinoisensis]|uniref:Uncharacterized protein n=1 Tax=Paenibacillus illinoisensis TaxID=59845 RepID=A0A2W0C716_9BACL|nr:hypothetical protein PIL02S_05544 [Paenibacillus illinoisensis]